MIDQVLHGGSTVALRKSARGAALPNLPIPGIGGSPSVARILDRAREGRRVTSEEGVVLLREASLLELGDAAGAARERVRPGRVVSYQVDRNINYTNVCIYRCTFCAFYRRAGDAEGYVLPLPEIGAKVEETIVLGGTGVLLQGGVHADLPFAFYEELLSFLRERYPGIHRHAFSAPEIYFLAKKEKTPVRDVLARLKDAGLQSVPGGGAEILEDGVRKRIFALTKSPEAKWAEVHREAHGLGMPTTATMMFGIGETAEERVHHLEVVRRIQDAAMQRGPSSAAPEPPALADAPTGSFTAFIPWTFQEENTALDGQVETAGGADYLRMLALSRIYLDNVPHVQGSWLTQGTKIGQVSLAFGADDLGSIMIEENVVAAAGSHNSTTEAQLRALIEDAGYTPKQRGSVYERCQGPCCAKLNA